MQQLEADDTSAVETLNIITKLLDGTPHMLTLEPILQRVGRYEFEEAFDLLSTMVSALDSHAEGSNRSLPPKGGGEKKLPQ